MATEYTGLGLRKIASGDTNYAADDRATVDMLDVVLGPTAVFEVSPRYTDVNLGIVTASDRRHYSTIQAAITAWEARSLGDGAYGQILVHPGRYEEDLTITKSVALIASHGGPLDGGGAARGVYLLGSGGGGPVITFDPADDETHGLLVKGVSIRNTSESGSGGSPVAILDTVDQGSGSYGSYQSSVVFDDCNFRQTLNGDAWWHAMFYLRANHWLTMRNCRCTVPTDYAGTNYVRHVFFVNGNTTTSRAARLSIKGGEYNHGVFSGVSNYTVLVNNAQSSAFAHRATFNRTPSNGLYGINPGGIVTGFTAAEAEAYGNLHGVNAVEF